LQLLIILLTKHTSKYSMRTIACNICMVGNKLTKITSKYPDTSVGNKKKHFELKITFKKVFQKVIMLKHN